MRARTLLQSRCRNNMRPHGKILTRKINTSNQRKLDKIFDEFEIFFVSKLKKLNVLEKNNSKPLMSLRRTGKF